MVPVHPHGVPLSPVPVDMPQAPAEPVQPHGVPLSPVQPKLPQPPRDNLVPVEPTPVQPIPPSSVKPAPSAPLLPDTPLLPVQPRRPQEPVEKKTVESTGIPLIFILPDDRPLVQNNKLQEPLQLHLIDLGALTPTEPQPQTQPQPQPQPQPPKPTGTPLTPVQPRRQPPPSQARLPLSSLLGNRPQGAAKPQTASVAPAQRRTPHHSIPSRTQTGLPLPPTNLLRPRTRTQPASSRPRGGNRFDQRLSAEQALRSLEVDDTPQDTVERLDSRERSRARESQEVLDFDDDTRQRVADRRFGLPLSLSRSEAGVQRETQQLSRRVGSSAPQDEPQHKIQQTRPQEKIQPLPKLMLQAAQAKQEVQPAAPQQQLVEITGQQDTLLEIDPSDPLSVELKEHVDEFLSLERVVPSDPSQPATFIIQEEPVLSTEVQDTDDTFISREIISREIPDSVDIDSSERLAAGGGQVSTQSGISLFLQPLGNDVEHQEAEKQTNNEGSGKSSLQQAIEDLMASLLHVSQGFTDQQNIDTQDTITTSNFHVTDGDFGNFHEASEVLPAMVLPESGPATQTETPTEAPADDSTPTSLAVTEELTMPSATEEVVTVLPTDEVTTLAEDEPVTTASSAEGHTTTPDPVEMTTPALTDEVTTPALTEVTTPGLTEEVTAPALTEVTTPALTEVTTPGLTEVTTPALTEEVTTVIPEQETTAANTEKAMSMSFSVRQGIAATLPPQQQETTLSPVEEQEPATTGSPSQEEATTSIPGLQEAITVVTDEQEATTVLPEEDTTTTTTTTKDTTTAATTTTSAAKDTTTTITTTPGQDTSATTATTTTSSTTEGATTTTTTTTTAAGDALEDLTTTTLPDDQTTTASPSTTKKTTQTKLVRTARLIHQRPRVRYQRPEGPSQRSLLRPNHAAVKTRQERPTPKYTTPQRLQNDQGSARRPKFASRLLGLYRPPK
ncbi:serine-rich adhesin for platelets-like [Portunus trituberculatus]|uniref:serine-rich adhesin for platelets-like n=1 Tax=Portunus trituberculatus TaxID=210409 RepID=UPI001E1CB892|nr:serine-rich adhesin for platelets-like [Portunus trituberculatus]